MQIKFMVDEREIQLGCAVLEALVGNLPDEDESLTDLFHELAQSNIAGVRASVARKSVISAETVAILASDSSPEVIEALVNAQCGKVSESDLAQIVQRNWSGVNRDIARSVESYSQSDITEVAKLLAGSADPSVRAALASNGSAPKLIVRQLLKDPDPDVRRLAQNTLKPSVEVAIQYDPKRRGIYLALAYCRIQRGSEPFFDIYGTCDGYSGGGCYEHFFFHVGEEVGEGFISYTPASGEDSWRDDRIGVSGLAGQDLADDARALCYHACDILFPRWCCWNDNGDQGPDLTPAAKRRLNCEKREVFYTSPGFDQNLLAFISPEWSLSVHFGAVANELERQYEDVLKYGRARRRAFITAIVKYPQLIEGNLRLLSNQAFGRCGRTKLVFADNQGGELVVACQWDKVTGNDVERIATLKPETLSSEHETHRLMVVAETIDPAVRHLLDRDGISWRELPRDELCHFLDEEGDVKLSEFISAKKGLNPPPSYLPEY